MSDDLTTDLRARLEFFDGLKHAYEAESRALRTTTDPDPATISDRRAEMLGRLTRGLDELKGISERWRNLPPAARQTFPEVPDLLRRCQDALMKVIVLDRENEKELLRRSLIDSKTLPATAPRAAADAYLKGNR